MEKEIKVKLKRMIDNSYPIIFSPKILKNLGKILTARHRASSYVIICDETTKKLFGGILQTELLRAGMKSVILSIPAGEKSKSLNAKSFLEESMLRFGCDRKSLIIALGGGVVGDLAGFVAATYMRGIDYIIIPTTLLAMVDSSIGGKTGIDNSMGKNLIGAFWQPKAVYIDLHLLKTLPFFQLKNGLFEVIKIFATSDERSFKFLQKNLQQILKRNPKVLNKIVSRAIMLKASVVSHDERESSKRMILNFGHTIGHTLEKLSEYKIVHGCAVALGMLVEAKLAVNVSVLSQTQFEVLKKLIMDLGVNPGIIKKYNFKTLVNITRGDKKSDHGKARYVLLQKIGKVEIKNNTYAHVVAEDEVEKALKDVTN